MLAVLGFITILLVLALIMSKKVSTLVALIFVPAITGFIAAFINAPNVIIQAAQAAAEKAGTAYVEPVITFGTRFTKALSILSADYMGKGLSSIVATGVMFIFAILFFSTCSDAGVFDPIINRILKFTGEDPVKVCIGTFLIGCIPCRSTCRRTLWATTDFRWCTSGPSSCWVRRVWARLPLCSRSLMRWGLAL